MCRNVCVCILLSLVLANPASADTKRVEIYPDQARVEKTIVAEHKTDRLKVELSAHTRSNTLRVRSDGPGISSLASEKVSFSPGERISSLKKKLSILRGKKSALQSRVDSLKGEVAYIKKTKPVPDKGIQSVLSMGEALRKRLQKAYSELFEQEKGLKEIRGKIKEVERKIKEATGKKDEKLVLKIVFSSQLTPGTKIHLGYVVDNCGWKSMYRLNAKPGKQEVGFRWKARIWQNTGVDWKGAEMSLSTSKPVWRLLPPAKGNWSISPVRRKKVLDAAEAPRAKQGSRALKAFNQSAVSGKKERQFRTVYQLGNLSVESGKKKTVNIKKKSWPAEFDYLLRPYKAQAAFVRARVDFGQAVRMPAGKASYFLDSAYVGEGRLDIRDVKKELFFGPDRQIKVGFVNVDKKSGESGFLDKKDTYSWKWETVITNNKSLAVDVVVQDILPKLGDKEIEMEKTFNPKPDKIEDRTINWKLHIPSGKQKKVLYGYDIAYPRDMRLNMGR